jgi:ferredoxin-NADP reductase/MOSC domain-containing protein YiiM
MVHLLSVNVGLPRDIEWQGKLVNTAIWKTPVKGPCMVRRLNIDGDGQADRAGHGGENRAVYVYQTDSYRYWEEHLGRRDFVYGQFGENFTVDGLPDAEVCIGDRYRIGEAVFEVSQPRVTCYRLGIRMELPEMAALLVSHGRPGFYLRVLKEGKVQEGDEVEQVASAEDSMTVADINDLLYKPGHPRDRLERALRILALSPGWRRSFQSLLEQSPKNGASPGNAGLTGAKHLEPAWEGFRSFKVSRMSLESESVKSLELEPTDGKRLPAFLPGQFIVLGFQPGGAPVLLRSYSLSGQSNDAYYRVSIKREAHGVASAYVNDELGLGEVVQASAPRGSFTLAEGETPIILLSAGIGATPVLAMLHALAVDRSGRKIWWLHGARNGREHPFADEVRGLLQILPHAQNLVCYSTPDPADKPGIDYDRRSRLDLAVIRSLGLPLDADFYLCGPASFMDDLAPGIEKLGVERGRIHTEMFGSASSITPGIAAPPSRQPHHPDGPPGAGPLISFARSGLSVAWNPKFNNLLEFAEACDVPVRWSCRTGVCHTCETGLISGAVCYRPDPIDAPADGNVLLCCSQPKDELVIDM